MRELIRSKLWIGNAGDARDPAVLMTNEIVAVVDLAIEESPAVLSRELTYCRIPLSDGEENSSTMLRLAVSTVFRLVKEKKPLLVACGAGMSRAPVIAALALAAAKRITPEEALERVLGGAPSDVSPSLWSAALKACARLAASDAAEESASRGA